MGLNFWLIIMGAALLAIGAAVSTILFEHITYDKKQKEYENLHRQMGLGNENSSLRHDSSSGGTDRK